MKYLIILTLLLGGCTSMKDKYCGYANIPVSKPIEIDPRLFEPCDQWILPLLPLSYEGILENTKDNKLIHLKCVKKQKDGVTVLKKFSNNK